MDATSTIEQVQTNLANGFYLFFFVSTIIIAFFLIKFKK